MIIPFVLLLLAIALMPFIRRAWWEKNYPFVSVGLGCVPMFYYLFVLRNAERMISTGIDYGSFIVLIGSLFVVAGGIHIRIRGHSTPFSNTILLSVGALASSVLGTTGASMILIRPYLRSNQHRLRAFHIVFFIFLVSNIGGALSPIGDPPLFLGYLSGVPFFWVFENTWPIWLIAVASLILLFYALDTLSFRKAEPQGLREEFPEEARVGGLDNLIFICIIVLSVFIEHPKYLREGIMIAAAAASYATTESEVHRKNGFNLIPLKEVAILFFGIFATMVPALDWLEANAAHIGISSAGQFYWGSGALSSVLDNAPTYRNFLSAAIGLFVDQGIIDQVQLLVSGHGANAAALTGMHADQARMTFSVLQRYHADLVAAGSVSPELIKVAFLIANESLYLKAISIGSVFFGAMTYIGNGPNFMVKSISEQMGVESPDFSTYIVRYSLPILIPLFALVWFLFFRG
jgi:Na+/H+ antiporter NhaD/arsenite permease-like protein